MWIIKILLVHWDVISWITSFVYYTIRPFITLLQGDINIKGNQRNTKHRSSTNNKSNVKQNFKRIFMIMFIHKSSSQRMLLIMYFLPDVRVTCKTTFLLTSQRLSVWNRRIQKSGNSRWRGKTDC